MVQTMKPVTRMGLVDIRVDGTRSILAGPGAHRWSVDVLPDLAEARRILQVMRRVDSCQLHLRGGELSGELLGVGHRLPVRRPVPVRIVLGLSQLGVPTTIDVEES